MMQLWQTVLMNILVWAGSQLFNAVEVQADGEYVQGVRFYNDGTPHKAV